MISPIRKIKNNPNDVIHTPLSLATKMIDFANIKDGERVLDPSRGSNKVFYDNFPTNCIKDWCEITEGKDFFAYNEPVDIIIGNPPFSLWNEWIKHTIKLNPRAFCYVMSCYNMTAPRLKVIEDAGYALTRFHICKVDWWFSQSFVCVFEKGQNTFLSINAKIITCDVCGARCGRGNKNADKNKCGLIT